MGQGFPGGLWIQISDPQKILESELTMSQGPWDKVLLRMGLAPEAWGATLQDAYQGLT